MRRTLPLSLCLFMLSLQVFAGDCDGLLLPIQHNDVAVGQLLRIDLAYRIKALGLQDTAYVAKWKTKGVEAKGPMLSQGETLVVGVPTESIDSWMNTIGKYSIGIGTYGLPEENNIAAALRVGDQLFPFNTIQSNKLPVNFKDSLFKNQEGAYGFTEATFMLSDAEIQSILGFFEHRRSGQIVAQTDNIKGYPKGKILKPKYKHSGFDLKHESCAAATTSFLADMWLDNMNDQNLANSLRKLRQRIKAHYNYVTRRNIYENFRNPYAHISLFRIEKSERKLSTHFIKNNGWGLIRGLYPYAFIPDGGLSHEVERYKSRRLTIDHFLKSKISPKLL